MEPLGITVERVRLSRKREKGEISGYFCPTSNVTVVTFPTSGRPVILIRVGQSSGEGCLQLGA